MKCPPGAFSNFDISDATIAKLLLRGITELFPIQYETYNDIKQGFDVVAQARTGTGKTFAFALPLIENLQAADAKYLKGGKNVRGRLPRVLVLTPTRELASQVASDFQSIISGSLEVLAIYGGTQYGKHEDLLCKGIDIVVGTPGRVKDLLYKGALAFDKIAHVILDEVDRMLDMGFVDDVDEILASAYEKDEKPQTLLFSATLPVWVNKTAKKFLRAQHIKRVCLVDEAGSQASVTVQHLALMVPFRERASTLADVIRVYGGFNGTSQVIVFCDTKKSADELSTHAAMPLNLHVLHGDIQQDKREIVLKKFREGKYRVLVTTDVAARGLDIANVDLVVQCDPPKDAESYVHRSGRTGRAGRPGVCICFYNARSEWDLKELERKNGIVFKKISAPTAQDVIEAATQETIALLSAIPESTLKQFTKSATTVITKLGAERALCAALAQISGKTDIKSRSLLSAREGYVAFVMYTTCDNVRGKGYLYNSLRRVGVNDDVIQAVSYVTCTKDQKGFVFDVLSKHSDALESTWKDGKFDSLEKVITLPEVEIPTTNQNHGLHNRSNGTHNNSNHRGGGAFKGGAGGNKGPPKCFGAKRSSVNMTESSTVNSKRIKFNDND